MEESHLLFWPSETFVSISRDKTRFPEDSIRSDFPTGFLNTLKPAPPIFTFPPRSRGAGEFARTLLSAWRSEIPLAKEQTCFCTRLTLLIPGCLIDVPILDVPPRDRLPHCFDSPSFYVLGSLGFLCEWLFFGIYTPLFEIITFSVICTIVGTFQRLASSLLW